MLILIWVNKVEIESSTGSIQFLLLESKGWDINALMAILKQKIRKLFWFWYTVIIQINTALHWSSNDNSYPIPTSSMYLDL